MPNVLVALSGGVDSAVAALLLQQQGYEVSGAYIRTWMNEEMPLADCPAQQDIEDSRAVAEHLGIPHRIVNLVNEYREHVVNYLVKGYQQGITPNPDIMCNREMKFGIFQRYALDQGFDAMQTLMKGMGISKADMDKAMKNMPSAGLNPNIAQQGGGPVGPKPMRFGGMARLKK